MKKQTLKILIGIIAIIAFFVISFIITTQLLSIFEYNEVEEIADIKNNAKKKKDEVENKKEQEDNYEKNEFEGKILDIEGKKLVVQNPAHLVDYSIYEGDMNYHNDHKVNIEGKLYVTASYILYLDNVQIKDVNKKNISISDLKAGDIIRVSTKNVTYTVDTIFTPLTSDNIKLIEKM